MKALTYTLTALGSFYLFALQGVLPILRLQVVTGTTTAADGTASPASFLAYRGLDIPHLLGSLGAAAALALLVSPSLIAVGQHFGLPRFVRRKVLRAMLGSEKTKDKVPAGEL